MTDLKVELASQPDCWRQAAKLADAPGLPRAGERVALAGCGTSWLMGKAYAALRESAGQGETDAFQAAEFPPARNYDRVVVITRSGTTPEVLRLLDSLGGRCLTTVVTADPATPAATAATDVIALDFAGDESAVPTRFATTALALLRAHLGEDIHAAASDAEVAVRLPLPVHPALVDQVTFVGRGWTVGLAEEAALRCRQAAGFWADAYPAMDHRHGALALAGPRRVVWAMGDVPPGLADEVEATGAAFVHSRYNGGYAALGRWRSGRAPLDPMADLIVAQRFALLLATSQGLDPARPRNPADPVVVA